MAINCEKCGKECASEFGLKSHMKSHATEAATPEPNGDIRRIDAGIKQVLVLLSEVAKEQANKNFSGTRWLCDINHRIQLLEKQMGIGPGPRTDKPL